jgi:hypothetical protein
MIGAGMDNEANDEPDDEGDQQQGGDALNPPMPHPFMGGAQAAHA